MHLAYLGFLDVLKNVLNTVFNSVLKPVLKTVFMALFDIVSQLLQPILAGIYYQILIVFLKIVDFLSYVVDIFAGVRTVSAKGVAPAPLLDMFFNQDPISRAFAYITFFAAGLSVLFAVYGVAKSVGDMALDGKNPVGEVLRRALKSALAFMLVPLMVLFMLRLSAVLLDQVAETLSAQTAGPASASYKTPKLGGIIFLSGTMNAAQNSAFNSDPHFSDKIREPYMTGEQDYGNLTAVKSDFDLLKYDYFTSTCAAILVAIMLIGSLFLFVRRIFELLLLYLVSPMFVAAMPLDDGGIFAKWREMFIAKMFSGFGTVIAMKLFFMFVPMLFSNDIQLITSGFFAKEADAMLRLFIIIGGAWAAWHAQTTLLHLLSPEAAAAAQESLGIGLLVGNAALSKVGGAWAAGKGGNDGKDGKDGKDSGGGKGSGGSPGGDGGGGRGGAGDGAFAITVRGAPGGQL
ncbi:MAG: hypothetical protein LBL83_00720 [Clostridiales bacterium]|jgi:hypothetical protein|nr:hypothetical protein [Clostridiales bacterium]